MSRSLFEQHPELQQVKAELQDFCSNRTDISLGAATEHFCEEDSFVKFQVYIWNGHNLTERGAIMKACFELAKKHRVTALICFDFIRRNGPDIDVFFA